MFCQRQILFFLFSYNSCFPQFSRLLQWGWDKRQPKQTALHFTLYKHISPHSNTYFTQPHLLPNPENAKFESILCFTVGLFSERIHKPSQAALLQDWSCSVLTCSFLHEILTYCINCTYFSYRFSLNQYLCFIIKTMKKYILGDISTFLYKRQAKTCFFVLKGKLCSKGFPITEIIRTHTHYFSIH